MRKLSFMSQVVCPKLHSHAVANPIFKPRSYAYESQTDYRFDLILTGSENPEELKPVFSLIIEFRNVYCNNDNFVLNKQLLS